MRFDGGDEEDRTLDLTDANRTLSQLSYIPTKRLLYYITPTCKKKQEGIYKKMLQRWLQNERKDQQNQRLVQQVDQQGVLAQRFQYWNAFVENIRQTGEAFFLPMPENV